MRRGSLARLVLLALLWGSGFLWIKISLRGFTPAQIVLVRLTLGALVLAPVALARGMRLPHGRVIWGHLFMAALIANAVPYTLFGIGERTVGSNVAGVINATTPLWTALVAFLAGTDRTVTLRRGAGLALGFAGTLLIFAPWESAGEIASWGGLAILAASASYGISFVYMGRFLTNRGIPALMLSASQLAAGAVLMVFTLPFGGLVAPHWRLDAVASLLILGIFGTGLAYVLNYRLIADEGPTVASTTTYLLPLVAVGLGALVVDETVSVAMIVGMVVVLGGVALVQRRPSHPPTSEPSPAAATRGR